MSNNIEAQRPPFLFTYWNPLDQNSSLAGNWFDYVKDVSLAKYTADSVGKYVQQASAEQINAIYATSSEICGVVQDGFATLQKSLGLVEGAIRDVNQRLDLILDESRTSNLLLENMAELLRIPDSQKQRQHHIEQGLKFLKNATKDEDLYKDALSELLEAERLMTTDYFVLHRIGMIYLHVPAVGDIEKAMDYFTRAGKYAAVESHPSAARLSNILNKRINQEFAEQADTSLSSIASLAAESYYEAGTALYALSRYDEAVAMAKKAVNIQPNVARYSFFLAKYLARTGAVDSAIEYLQRAITLAPEMALATIGDFDLNNHPAVIDFLNRKNLEVDIYLQELIVKIDSSKAVKEYLEHMARYDCLEIGGDIDTDDIGDKGYKEGKDDMDKLSAYLEKEKRRFRSVREYLEYLGEDFERVEISKSVKLKSSDLDEVDDDIDECYSRIEVIRDYCSNLDLERTRVIGAKRKNIAAKLALFRQANNTLTVLNRAIEDLRREVLLEIERAKANLKQHREKEGSRKRLQQQTDDEMSAFRKTEQQKQFLADAKLAEMSENSKWLRKKDYHRARELYQQVVALGSKEAWVGSSSGCDLKSYQQAAELLSREAAQRLAKLPN